MSAAVMKEYEAALRDVVFMPRSDRALLRMYGRDPLRIIQGIVTNDVAGAPADRAVYAAFLTPKGRMLADVRVMKRGNDLLLDVPASAVPDLLAYFKRSIPPLFARFEDMSAKVSMFGVYGPNAHARIESLGLCAPADQRDAMCQLERDGSATIVIANGDTAAGGYDIIADSAAIQAIQESLQRDGAVAMSRDTFDVLRVEAGTPVWGRELNTDTIPLEAGLLDRAISTGKGCYTGQEVIIRVLHRGHVNRHLRGLFLGSAAAPAAGAALLRDDGRNVGAITSAVASPRFAQTIALAYVRREVEPGGYIHLDDATRAEVAALPFESSMMPTSSPSK